MNEISYAGIFISVLLVIYTLSQLGKMISAITAKKNKRIYIHLLGFLANVLIAILVFLEALKFKIDSDFFVYGSIIIAVLYYIIAVFDSLFEIKEVKKGIRKRRV